MEQNYGGASREHQNVYSDATSDEHEHGGLEVFNSIKDQNEHLEATDDPLNQDKIVGYDYSRSSSSTSSSSSNLLDVNYDEKDAFDLSFSRPEENGSESPPDMFPTTPKWSMTSASPRTGTVTPTSGFPLSPELLPKTYGATNPSPKQSPPIQVMGRPSGYDPDRIPSSVFGPKPANTTDWSTVSNESLFSIHMGKSGELNKSDDWINYPCFPSDITNSGDLTSFYGGLPPVVERATENDRNSGSTVGESGEKEELPEIHNASTIDSNKEKEKLSASEGLQSFSPSFALPEGKGGTSPARNSGSTARLSDESGNSNGSFAFPVLGGSASLKGEERHRPVPLPLPKTPAIPEARVAAEPNPPKPPEPIVPVSTHKSAGSRWFNCFCCCTLCCR